MSQFRIRATSRPYSIVDRVLTDEQEVINLICQLELKVVDVERDGVYAFTVHVSEPGVWQIFTREQSARD